MNILITGGSRGIGIELVKLFAKDHQVYCLTRNIDPINKLNLSNVKVMPFDFLSINKEEFKNFLDSIDEIDILINNAGLLYNKPFVDISESELTAMYTVNCMGPFWLIQQLMDKLNAAGGHVVNIGSMGGVQGSVKFPGLSGYSSAKGALAILTECLAEEYKESPISFNYLALGAVQTEMLQQAFPGYQAPVSPVEMAKYIIDFAINGRKYINGKVISVSLSTP